MEEITDIDLENYRKEYTAHAGNTLPLGESRALRDDIINALKTVADPEIAINIWDMGLVYKLEQKDNGDVYIEMTVTSPMCPVADMLPNQAAEAVSQVKGVGMVEVKIVWDPAWDMSMMSDEAKLTLDLL